jgi:hypothetical protein
MHNTPLPTVWCQSLSHDWVHIGFEVALILASLVLSIYSFRLFNRFFKGGLFGSSFRIFGFAALLFAITYAFDVVLDWMELSTTESELLYYILNLSFVVILTYGVHTLYKAWVKLGLR